MYAYMCIGIPILITMGWTQYQHELNRVLICITVILAGIIIIVCSYHPICVYTVRHILMLLTLYTNCIYDYLYVWNRINRESILIQYTYILVDNIIFVLCTNIKSFLVWVRLLQNLSTLSFYLSYTLSKTYNMLTSSKIMVVLLDIPKAQEVGGYWSWYR